MDKAKICAIRERLRADAVGISVEIKMFRIRSTWSIWDGSGERDHPDLRRSSKQRGSLGLKERAEKTSF